MSRTRDDAARKKFLGTLVDALDERWVVGYAELKPYGVIGATLRCQGIEGFVQVVPSVVENNVITWQPFPGTGRPHFDLKPDGTGHLRTCILADAVAALQRWAASKAPLVRGAPTPMLPSMRAELEAIAAAPAATVEDAIDMKPWAVTSAGKEQLAAARDGMDIAGIARAFPRDADGRLLATRVLLAPIYASKPLAAGRAVFLAVQGPRVRRDGDRLQLVLVDAIDANETHRWMDARWLWRTDTKRPAPDKRAAACLALLDAGEFDKALALFNFELSPRAIKVLEGIPLGTHSSHPEEYRETLRRTLWSLAPWRLPAHGGRLVLLPHQRHQVKSWIAWKPPAIDLEGTGSNTRMAQVRWKRDLDDDLARLDIQRAHAPTATKPAKATKSTAPLKPLADMIIGKKLWKADTALKHAKQRATPDAMAELFAILDGDGKPAERANAIWIAGAIAGPGDGARLAAFLSDRHAEVRRMAIEAVKRAGYTAAIPTLARIVCTSRSGDRTEGVYAATAMKVLSGRAGPSGMLPYFASDDPRIREAACHAYSIFHGGEKAARPHLEHCLLDDDAAVVSAAKKAFLAIAKRA